MSAIREAVNRAYQSFGQGNIPGVLAECDDAIVFSLPGTSVFEPTYSKETFGNLAITLMGTTNGQFKEVIIDVCEGEKYVAVVLDHELNRGGEDITYRTTHFWGLGANGFTSWREVPDDLRAFEYAWRKE